MSTIAFNLLAACTSGGERTADPTTTLAVTRPATGQPDVSADVLIVRAYGVEHAEDFGDLKLDRPNRHVIAGFVRNLEEHQAALRALVSRPDVVQIVPATLSWAERERIVAALKEEFAPPVGQSSPYQGISLQFATVTLNLRADGEPVAARLHQRYGDALGIRVGVKSYPSGEATGAACTAERVAGSAPPGLSLRLELTTPRVGAGHNGTGRLVMRNTGSKALEVNTDSSTTGIVTRPGDPTVVGVFTGGSIGTGLHATLESGESLRPVGVGFGTASCLAGGYALPPGGYEVRAVIQLFGDERGGERDITRLLSPPVPVEVVPG